MRNKGVYNATYAWSSTPLYASFVTIGSDSMHEFMEKPRRERKGKGSQLTKSRGIGYLQSMFARDET